MFHICTIGSGTRDVFIKSAHFEREPSVDAPDGFNACFPMGAKISLDDVIFETGGGATNAAVTFRRFGLKTACACRLGDDDNGRAILQALKKERVDVRAAQIDKQDKTAYSIILLAGSGHRSILVYRGAANKLDPMQINWRRIQSQWFYLTSLGGDLHKNNAVFVQAAHQDSRMAWNPGNGELRHGLKKLTALIRQTDLLFLNREEAALLTEQAPRHLDRILEKLGNLPRFACVITDGAHGAYVYDTQAKTLWHGEALKGKRINTTGAGDAFGSGFTAAFIKTGNLVTGLRAGLCNSLGVITHMGAKAGILDHFPTERELNHARIKPLTV